MVRFEKYLFGVLVCFALSIIILPQYYITGDGASHAYNAKVLFDYVFGHERDFYKAFYTINRNLDPNWFGHLFVGFLTQLFPAWLADKFFQITYVLVFAFGFRFFIKALHHENTFLSFLFFPFLFTLAFQQGFYNYSLALGFFFYTMGYYVNHRYQLEHPFKQLILTALLLLTAFSHGMPVLYAMLMIFLLWLSEHFQLFIPLDFRKLSVQLSRLLLVFIPSLLLIFLFMLKRGVGREAHAWSIGKKLSAFFQFFASQSTRHAEVFPAIACSILLLSFLLVLIFTRIKVNIPKKMKLGYVLLCMMLFTFISYVTCPHSIGGAGSIDIRLAFLPPLFLLLYFATKRWTDLTKMIFIGCSFFISIVFLVIRFPYVMKASKIGNEIMTATDYIEDKSVILNLHFDYWQKLPNGDSVFHKDGSFLHFSDFLGAEKNKHLILLNNYEAEINYFPVNWQPGKNPRETVSGFIQGNLPPCGDYQLYEQKTKRRIDYIVFQQWRNDAMNYDCVKQLLKDMNEDFDKVYDSKHHYVMVFKRK
ncbi:MAG: hypothetical protein IPI46_12600 [Bacteroidetes bacterium]|nr:hypothetical protein [Bacteroidota bacterium]